MWLLSNDVFAPEETDSKKGEGKFRETSRYGQTKTRQKRDNFRQRAWQKLSWGLLNGEGYEREGTKVGGTVREDY